MKTNKAAVILIVALLFISGYNFLSCKRPVPPKAIVSVVNEKNEPVEGAQVVIRADSGRVIYLKSGMVLADTQLTDASGQISYEFRYEAIYNVKAKTQKKVGGVMTTLLQGSGVFILKEDETYSETVTIR